MSKSKPERFASVWDALADTAEHWGAPEAAQRISTVNSWYFEVARLKVAMLTGVSLLRGARQEAAE